MKVAIGFLGMLLVFARIGDAQSKDNSVVTNSRENAPVVEGPAESYTVFGATPSQEAALRAQIRAMHPEVLPSRVFFVPHWKYLDCARVFQLHVPTGYASLMFTHLPSRTVFIDNDRYMGEDWLGHWIAHELGHLTKNSPKEEDAEKAAREFRQRLKEARAKLTQMQPTAVQGTELQQPAPEATIENRREREGRNRMQG